MSTPKRSSQVCTHLSDRMRLAAVSLTLILRTRTMCTASILRITLESFSFLYAFSSSSRFVTSMTRLYGRGSLLLSIWQIYPERTFSRRYRGVYADQLENWFKYYDRKQFLILVTEGNRSVS